jgi:hypothetical protein
MSISEDLQTPEWDMFFVAQLAQRERAARDDRDWNLLRDCYHPDSHVRVSWFEGTGNEFADQSRRMVAKPGGGSIHQVATSVVTVNGDRALADTGCVILIRSLIHGVECDIATFCRHRSRVERIDGTWRLRTLFATYQKDTLAPTNPNLLPELDASRLASFRPSYRYLSYYNVELGYTPSQELPGADRPEELQSLIAADRHWLATVS